MEAAAAARGGPMAPMTPAQSRKQWRAVSEHHSGREEMERSKLGHSDERTIYEVQQGREPVDVDFCSISIDGTLDHDLLQQRLHDVARQREELQHMETELRAQVIARSEIMEIQNGYEAQLKEHANAASKLQEQLHEMEQAKHELERKLEEKDRELHAIKLDNEAAWAKEGLLREQNKELATFRRERDHSEAERAQHIQQLHDLQEHIQEKERQLIELQEQNRIAQETILFKDERLNEAQAWINNRVQELDVLQSSTLQAHLREHTEQYNQLWLGCQRQFAEMERHHMHAVQQLQFELADARQRSGSYTDDSHTAKSHSNDASQLGRNNGNQIDMNASSGNTGALPNGNSDDVQSYSSTVNTSTQVDHVPTVPIGHSSLLGMSPYLPPGEVTGMHPFLLQPGVSHSMPPQVPQSHVHFQPIPAISSHQQWQNQQAPVESLQINTQTEPPSSQNNQNIIRSDAQYNYESHVNGQPFHQDYLDVQIREGTEPEPGMTSSAEEAQVLELNNSSYLAPSQTEQSLQQISSQFPDSLRLDSLENSSETKAYEQNVQTSADLGLERLVLSAEKPSAATNSSRSDTPIYSASVDESTNNNAAGTVVPESFVSTAHTSAPNVGRTAEPALLDERSLLACMVRTIPAGGKIRISSTLPNRLGKMLAPLHWHDYKKKYGKLDDFVAAHSELFVIEDDYIQLREGAQEMIAATAAVAKVAAAAAASSPYSSHLPSVAVTPVAQTHRIQKKLQNQQLNGESFGVSGGLSNVKILSKSKDLNGPESNPIQPAVILNGGNGAAINRSSTSSTQGFTNGRLNSNFAGKQHGRMNNSAFTSRR